MSRMVYLNGSYVPEHEAKVSVFDRGFLFADGVYEVTTVVQGRLLDFPGHLARLHRSLAELALPDPLSDTELETIHRELIRRNQLDEGLIYLQITRGPAERDFAFPTVPQPTVVLFTQNRAVLETPAAEQGLKIITVPDPRWTRCDIKTVQLIGPSLCKMMAKKAGKDDAWLVLEDFITEGTSNNAYIINEQGQIITRQISNHILAGITRAAALGYAQNHGLEVIERPFSVAEARAAREAFITSATTLVTPVVEIDGHPIGSGQPGPITQKLRALYIQAALQNAL